MKRVLIISICSIVWFCSCKQKSTSKTEKVAIQSEIKTIAHSNKGQPSRNHDFEKYIYADTTYTLVNGKRITIQNSFPKGGMIEPNGLQYSNSAGKLHGFAAFWTRIINETDIPLELNINVPADSFPIFTPPDSYLKLFLPKEKFSVNKLSKFNYGLTEIKSYLDANFDNASILQKTINPNEEYIFYVITLSYEAAGTPRAGLILKEQDLYYKMSIAPHGSGIIPLGTITLKK
ncbi:hypothetical protein SAMN03080594_103111 [Arenibacter palladensis]|uniref:Lipoprotein n=1 Tax=Arenibacter palladensis TaxID=237373 RepID=A0A1M5A6Q0_9FLAO|nr:hypothetical protein [Arenibacter palladensis]SHF25825.1 hypothetical protein SAMN03080594_103111 [Arenibacter palladensis]